MLGSCSSSSWRILSAEVQRGSVDMDNFKPSRNVWGSEEAFLSPPEYSGPLAAALESEESSEDCEDYVSGLAEEIAQSMLREEEAAAEEQAHNSGARGRAAPGPAWSSRKMGSSPTSPLSTLAGFNWDIRSNQGSSGVPSPPTPQEDEAIDVLYGELLRVKLEDEVKLASQRQRHGLSLQQQVIRRPAPSPTSPDFARWSSNARLTSQYPSGRGSRVNNSHAGNDNVLALAIDRAMMAKQGRHPKSRGGGLEVGGSGGGKHQQAGAVWGGGAGHQAGGKRGAGGNNNNGRRRGEESQQQQHFSLFASNAGRGAGSGSGAGAGAMRAVFLGAPTSRECGGTGVFLPRRLGSTHHQDSKRKPACSTVLLPSHIVQALNLNVEDTLPFSHHHRRDFISPNHRNLRHYQAGSYRLEPKEELPACFYPMSHSTTLQEVAPNISLPSEWTY
ncbi:hypothetical protein L7F22_057603 [Adiantum nelumboides]|nr:hypothetical protein [Adiantum nelumboides]